MPRNRMLRTLMIVFVLVASSPIAIATSGVAILDVATGKTKVVKTSNWAAGRILSIDESKGLITAVAGPPEESILEISFTGDRRQVLKLKDYDAFTMPWCKEFAHSPATGAIAYCSTGSIDLFNTASTRRDPILSGGSFFIFYMAWRTPTEILVVHDLLEDRKSQSPKIDVLNTETSALRTLYSGSRFAISEYNGSLRLSPTGKKFLFTDNFAPNPGSQDLKLLDFATGAVTTIAEGAVTPMIDYSLGVWSPDEKYVAYVKRSTTRTPLSKEEIAKNMKQMEEMLRKGRPNQKTMDKLTMEFTLSSSTTVCRLEIATGKAEDIYAVPADLFVVGLAYLDQNSYVLLTQPADDVSNVKSILWKIDVATKSTHEVARDHFFMPLYAIENGKKIVCIRQDARRDVLIPGVF